MRTRAMLPIDQMQTFLPKLQELTSAHIRFLAAPHGSEAKKNESARQEAAVRDMDTDERRAAAAFAKSLEWLVTEK